MTSIALTTADAGSVRTVYRNRTRRAPARRTRRALPTRRRRRMVARRIPRGPRRLPKFVLANLDPFNSNSDGAKIPDSNTYPSFPVKIEDEVSMTTDATFGVCARVFRPYAAGMIVSGVAASANSWAYVAAFGGTTDSTRLSTVNSNFTLIRPVAHGIRLYAPTAPTSTTGFVHVCVYAQSLKNTTWSFPTNISQLNNCMFYQRFPLAMLTQKSVTVVNKFLDSSATRYLDPSSDVAAQYTDATFQTEGWGGIVVVVEGAPASTNALVVESIIHAEGLPFVNGLQGSTPAAPYNVQALEEMSRIAGHTPATVVQGEEEGYYAQAMDAISSGVNSYLGPAIRQGGYALGRYAANRGLQYVGRGISGVTGPRLQSGFRGGLLQIPANQY